MPRRLTLTELNTLAGQTLGSLKPSQLVQVEEALQRIPRAMHIEGDNPPASQPTISTILGTLTTAP
jgi:hypothetical protein